MSDAASDADAFEVAGVDAAAQAPNSGALVAGVEDTSDARPEAVVSLPLSHGQQRLWVIDQQDPGSPVYNVPTDVRLTGASTRACWRGVCAKSSAVTTCCARRS